MHPKHRLRKAFWMVLILCLVLMPAGCGDAGHAHDHDDLPVRDVGQPPTPAQLADAVAAHLVSEDFEEFNRERLYLDVRGDLLFVKGVVNARSFESVYHILEDEPGVHTVVLTYVPGSNDDEVNLKLGRLLHDIGMITYLPAQAEVASGGTDLFLAGVERIVERGARIGVHSWSDDGAGSGAALPRDHPEHERYLDYYRDIGIDEDFYWFTLQAAPPEDIHWMTEEEMTQYAVHTDLR